MSLTEEMRFQKLLEAKLEQNGYHFTTDKILDTLEAMNVTHFQLTFYMAAYNCVSV